MTNKTFVVLRPDVPFSTIRIDHNLKPNEFIAIRCRRDIDRMMGLKNPKIIWHSSAMSMPDYSEIVHLISLYFTKAKE